MYYDIVIVGAGPGGAIAAKTLDNLNLSVCLIDTKPKEKIGEKVCGDAVGKEFFDFLHEKLNLEYPDEEIKDRINGIKVFSPDRRTVFKVETKDGGYMIDRLKFGQHLLRQIKNVNLMDNAKFVDFYEKGIIVERTENGNDKIKTERIECKIVVDASGFNASVRKKTNSEFMEKEINKDEFSVCYREIKKYKFEDPHYCHIYLSSKFSPGGYVWEFPEGDEVNAGLGVLYPANPKKYYEEYKKFRGEKFSNSEILNAGGGITPTRKPIDSLVAMQNGIGIMLVGDAACQVNPIHGGGIGQAMRAGYLAGITIKKIYEKNKCIDKISLDDLWEYNYVYMQNFGGNTASLDLFRIFLQSLSDEEVNSGMSAGLIKEDDLNKISEGEEINLSIAEKVMRLTAGISSINVAKKLALTVKKMKEVKELYRNYPSHEKFPEWKKKVENLYTDFKKATIKKRL